MSTVRNSSKTHIVIHPERDNTLDGRPMGKTSRSISQRILGFFIGSVLLIVPLLAQAAEGTSGDPKAMLTTIRDFAQAVGKADRVAAGQRDFACLFKMAQQHLLTDGQFPDPLNPVYEWCEQRRVAAHKRMISMRDRALDNVWPGPGQLVDFADFQRFFIAETKSQQIAPSFFVMPAIAQFEANAPFSIDLVASGALPHASFPSADESSVVAAPTMFVTTKISYPNPLTAPISNGPGVEDWAVPYKKSQRIIKSVNVKWVVLSDLKRLGFPTDQAVLDLPLDGPHGTTIPFVVDLGGFVPKSAEWFSQTDQPEAITKGIQQAQAATKVLDAVMQLNRVLMIAPTHKQALEVFADQLYQGFLQYGGRLNGIQVHDPLLAKRFNELYWTVQSQTDRFDMALGMEIGGKAEPMPADYLYRMIPVMEALASLEPGNFSNRLRLASTYRWTNDQMAALSSPQELLTEIPSEQPELRAEVLLELAWARIGKVAWNRHFDDPDIRKGYESAKKALELAQDPLNKFSATYAMAYSLAFHVPRDNQAMYTLLKEARGWFEKIPGATPEAWAFMLNNDTLKGLVETDPTFKGLLAARSM
ncbi:MAG: hypothetical protein R3B83_09195 [Nitrospirales bacterium]|nr:hypothetical protein [Nitrospirales bacterium]